MAYDETLAQRFRRLPPNPGAIEERTVFGATACLANGHIGCGIVDDWLMVRLSRDVHDEARKEGHVRPMHFTAKGMRGCIDIEPRGIREGRALGRWVRRGLWFASSVPPKQQRRLAERSPQACPGRRARQLRRYNHSRYDPDPAG